MFFFLFPGQCAILSPAFKVREFSITDVVPYSVSLKWNSAAEEGLRLLNLFILLLILLIVLVFGLGLIFLFLVFPCSDCEVFPKNHPAPFSKVLSFYRKEPFTLEAYYNNLKDLPYPNPSIGTIILKFVFVILFLLSEHQILHTENPQKH